MGKRPNYQNLYDDMIAQRNTALERVALLEGEIVNYWQPESATVLARAEAAEARESELYALLEETLLEVDALRAQLDAAQQAMRTQAAQAAYYGCPHCGAAIELPAPPQE